MLAEDGVGCEPASAATIAGVRKLVRAGKIPWHADIVCVLTGHQLKDTEYIMRHRSEVQESRQRLRVEPNLEALRKALEQALGRHLSVVEDDVRRVIRRRRSVPALRSRHVTDNSARNAPPLLRIRAHELSHERGFAARSAIPHHAPGRDCAGAVWRRRPSRRSRICASSPSRSARTPIPSSSKSRSRPSANSPPGGQPRLRTPSAFSFISSTFVRNGNVFAAFAPMHPRKRARPCRSAGHSTSCAANKFRSPISNECLPRCTSSLSLRLTLRKRSAAASSITSCASGERWRRCMGIWMPPQSGLLILGSKLCGSPMRSVRPRLHPK